MILKATDLLKSKDAVTPPTAERGWRSGLVEKIKDKEIISNLNSKCKHKYKQ